MLDIETLTHVMKGFDMRVAMDARDYSLAAEVLHRVAEAAFASTTARGNGGVTLSFGYEHDNSHGNHRLPCAAFRLQDGNDVRWAIMSIGRVASESSRRDPENEWCINFAFNSVVYVPKLIADGVVQALAERLAPFVSKTPS
ncbi:hypothetical protein [Sorangium sp. So ce693]|uniref:hypothetical protein n=1 Tax=Sorangium sp. So ce693 TaxID=3133318 RepID=UPI003F5DA38E